MEKVLTEKESLALFIWNVVPGVNIDEACTWVGSSYIRTLTFLP